MRLNSGCKAVCLSLILSVAFAAKRRESVNHVAQSFIVTQGEAQDAGADANLADQISDLFSDAGNAATAAPAAPAKKTAPKATAPVEAAAPAPKAAEAPAAHVAKAPTR